MCAPGLPSRNVGRVGPSVTLEIAKLGPAIIPTPDDARPFAEQLVCILMSGDTSQAQLDIMLSNIEQIGKDLVGA
jgi:hypothetical protein